jgi:hypothetical protein
MATTYKFVDGIVHFGKQLFLGEFGWFFYKVEWKGFVHFWDTDTVSEFIHHVIF